MKHFSAFWLLLCFFSLTQLLAQDIECATVIEPQQQALLQQLDRNWGLYQTQGHIRSGTTLYQVPVQLHILRKSDGSAGLTAAEFDAALDRVNELYLPAQIQFYQCNPVNVVDNDAYSPFFSSDVGALVVAQSVPNVINIYSVEEVYSGPNLVCGFAYYPGGPDFVVLANSCTNNGSTFAHELGHYFHLYHTHNLAGGGELVDGSNCSVAGDLLCDTPADPTLTGNVAADCSYIGTATDPNGQAYTPDVSNLMSYASKHCRISLSDDQYARMLFTLNNARSYLGCGSAISLDAALAADVTADCNNSLTVQFCDLSQGNPTGWSWDFGDGVGTSTQQHPSYTYNTPGVYTVSLTVSQGLNNDTEIIHQMIKVGTVSLPYFEDFEGGSSALGPWSVSASMKNAYSIASPAAFSGSLGLLFEGVNNATASPAFQTPNSATAFNPMQNPFFKVVAALCVDATSHQNLSLSFDLRQMYDINSNFTNFRVLVNGTQIGGVYQASPAEAWSSPLLDLSAYDNSVFTLAFEASTKFDDAGGNATYIDNINLTGDILLPVSYRSLSAYQDQLDVRLDWATYDEVNNDRFEVLRSLDGQSWQQIGSVAAQTDPAAERHYAFQDYQAGSLPAQELFYRLRQVDQNGNDYLSEIQTLTLSPLSRLQVFPNPSTGVFQVMSPLSGTFAVQVLDIQGRPLYQTVQTNASSSLNPLFALDLTFLPQGIYLLQLKQNGSRLTQRIIIGG